MNITTNILEKFKKNNFFLAFSIVFVLFLFSLLIFKSRWGINDDALMAMEVSGKGYSNQPTEYIVYTNIIIGKILKSLYQAIPSYPWYGFYTFFILFISFAALLYSLLTYKYSKTRILYFLIYFALFGLWLIRMPQFTVNSFMIGMSGIFLLLSVLYKEGTSSSSVFIICTGILFLIVSSLIRMDSFFLIIILSSPLILIEIIKSTSNKQLMRKVFVCLVLLFIVFVCHIYNKISYLKDNLWINTFEKAKLIVEMVDNNKVNEYSQRKKYIFNNVGWSRNDYLLMGDRFAADEQVFSKEKMEKILSYFKKNPTERITIHFKYMFKDKYFYGALLLLIFFIVQVHGRGRNTFGITASVLVSLVIIIYLGYFVRLPQRIYLPIFAFLSFLFLFFIKNDMELKSVKKWGAKTKFIFIIPFVGYFLFSHYSDNSSYKHINIMYKKHIARIHPAKNDIFFIWPGSLPLEFLSVFDNLDDFSEFRMLTTGYRFNDPVTMKMLKEFNIAGFSELIEKDNLFHIGNTRYMALFSKYLKEHYNLDIAFKVYMENPLFMVYKHTQITPGISSKLNLLSVNIAGINYNISVMHEKIIL